MFIIKGEKMKKKEKEKEKEEKEEEKGAKMLCCLQKIKYLLFAFLTEKVFQCFNYAKK